jgi:transposase InsO family protein
VRGRKKPQWVRDQVLELKALHPESSCRTIAATFCTLWLGIESVGKTWVAAVLREEKYRLEVNRQRVRQRRPPIMPRNVLWAIDLTGIPNGVRTRMALGIIDHGTRACIALQDLESKHSSVLLRHLAQAIRSFGKPLRIRTDNEAVFTSRLFRWGLRLLGIRHQLIAKSSPWQNGRIERFWGSLKGPWRLFQSRASELVEDLQAELKPSDSGTISRARTCISTAASLATSGRESSPAPAASTPTCANGRRSSPASTSAEPPPRRPCPRSRRRFAR